MRPFTHFYETRYKKIVHLEREFNFKYKEPGWYSIDNYSMYIQECKNGYRLLLYQGNMDQIRKRAANMFSQPVHTVEPL